MKEIHHRKKKQWFCERTFSQGSPIGKQNDLFLVHCFPVQMRAGGWGEEETQAEKEKE